MKAYDIDTTEDDLMSALEAIVARHNGDFDNEALLAFGPLTADAQADMYAIAHKALWSNL